MNRLGFSRPSVCPSSSPRSQVSCLLLAGPPWQYCPVCDSAHLLPTVRVSLWQPSFPFRSLSGRCPSPLPFPSYLVVGTSFLQPWLYRSRSAVFQLVFHENCSTHRHIFDVCQGRWAPCSPALLPWSGLLFCFWSMVLKDTIIMVDSFFFHYFEYIIPITFWPTRFSSRKSVHNLTEALCMWWAIFYCYF